MSMSMSTMFLGLVVDALLPPVVDQPLLCLPVDGEGGQLLACLASCDVCLDWLLNLHEPLLPGEECDRGGLLLLVPWLAVCLGMVMNSSHNLLLFSGLRYVFSRLSLNLDSWLLNFRSEPDPSSISNLSTCFFTLPTLLSSCLINILSSFCFCFIPII